MTISTRAYAATGSAIIGLSILWVVRYQSRREVESTQPRQRFGEYLEEAAFEDHLLRLGYWAPAQPKSGWITAGARHSSPHRPLLRRRPLMRWLYTYLVRSGSAVPKVEPTPAFTVVYGNVEQRR
jgi:hypothetical protein